MANSVIIDGLRSPIGLKNGKIFNEDLGIVTRADDLSADVLKSLIDKVGVDKNIYEDFVLGCAFPEGPQGMLMARGVTVLSDLPNTVAASVVNRFCGSSMDAVHQVSTSIESNDIEFGLAGGVEDMFGVPMGGGWPSFNDSLSEKEFYIGMGETAENLAQELSISREDQEDFAVDSHKKALKAQSEGRFDNEIAPININGTMVSKDEGPREPNLDKIRSLNPAFDANGTITPATSSPISIGASMIAISSEGKAKSLGIKPKFRIRGRAVAGVDWRVMGSGPLPATEKVLKKCNMTMNDIDAIELNEAFAAQSLYVIRKGGWDQSKINLNGGAIALGHPLGCSGSRIIITLMNVMEQNNLNTGLATMCIGTGQGIATVIERI
ncbi:MAG: acetyl-CoA C-acyltransferase [Candidatus Marinimicrobia bacterium]|nr:acetyl-CoA C-acyltransferase [Candidatus Neomarinimicrobiota bacterium]|tara:strand:- start:3615 stop:4757 length:1143 start_codon:yes stop_codon:yes gene_type:complete